MFPRAKAMNMSVKVVVFLLCPAGIHYFDATKHECREDTPMLRVTRDQRRLPETMQQFARSGVTPSAEGNGIEGRLTERDEESRRGTRIDRNNIQHDRPDHRHDYIIPYQPLFRRSSLDPTQEPDRHQDGLIRKPRQPGRADIDQDRPSALSEVEQLGLIRGEAEALDDDVCEHGETTDDDEGGELQEEEEPDHGVFEGYGERISASCGRTDGGMG